MIPSTMPSKSRKHTRFKKSNTVSKYSGEFALLVTLIICAILHPEAQIFIWTLYLVGILLTWMFLKMIPSVISHHK